MTTKTTSSTSTTHTAGPSPAPREARQRAGGLVELFGEPISIYSRRQALDDGVLVDVSEMASVAARRNSGSEVRFQLYRVPRGGRGVKPRLVTLQMHCGPGDEGEPVITISMLGED